MKITDVGSLIKRSCNECDSDKDIKEIEVGKVVIALCENCRNELVSFLSKKQRKTRNPNRIPLFLDKLQELWLKSPDLRFGQLVFILLSDIDKEIFYIEDDEWSQSVHNLKTNNR